MCLVLNFTENHWISNNIYRFSLRVCVWVWSSASCRHVYTSGDLDKGSWAVNAFYPFPPLASAHPPQVMRFVRACAKTTDNTVVQHKININNIRNIKLSVTNHHTDIFIRRMTLYQVSEL